MTTALLIRLSDNVLADEDFPIRRIEFSDGYIVSVKDLQRGVYSMCGMPDKGWHVNDLLEWLAFDSTGFYPEEYHEIKTLADERFRRVFNEQAFLDLVFKR